MRINKLLLNYFPIRLTHGEQDGWMAEWTYLGEKRVTEPFFDETLSWCRARQLEKSRMKCFSNLDFLVENSGYTLKIRPSAFIFHVSRCGSTMLTQAYAMEKSNLVISECPLLDEILRASERDPTVDQQQKQIWFNAALAFLGQLHSGSAKSFIIKLDCWHIHFYDLLRQWFPDTPFFFLSRTPEEVIASHEKKRGIHTVPGLINKSLMGISKAVEYGGNLNMFAADVIQQFYRQFTRIKLLKHPLNCFRDYADGTERILEDFASFTGIPIRNPEAVKKRLRFHSKDKVTMFLGNNMQTTENFPHVSCRMAYDRLRST